MQTYFNEICKEQKILTVQYQEICEIEEETYNRLMTTCLYFIEHQPSKYFNKYQISTWYDNNYKIKLIETAEALSGLSAIYSIVFPTCYFNEGILSHYPIIVNNFDMTDGDKLLHFLYLCTPFAELQYDYLILLCCNKPDTIVFNGLKITKRLLETLKQAVENDDETAASELSPPFPVEVTQQMVNCFANGYNVEKPAITGYEKVDRIGELLWALSKSQQVLTCSEDANYLSVIEEEYKGEILKILENIKSKIASNHFFEISNLCKIVFEGQEFSDAELNLFYDNLMKYQSK